MVRPQSATTAWQQAFFGLQWRQGDRILTSVQEYATNYINFLQVGLLSESQSLRVPESPADRLTVCRSLPTVAASRQMSNSCCFVLLMSVGDAVWS
jgi:hypothetical protein